MNQSAGRSGDAEERDDPQPFDWSEALELIVLMTEMETSCTEFVLGAQPPFALAPDELEDLSIVDRTVRDLWARYRPATPLRHRFATIAEENAAVDTYEAEKERLRELLRHLIADDSWRAQFSIADHAAIELVRSIVVSRNAGGGSSPE